MFLKKGITFYNRRQKRGHNMPWQQFFFSDYHFVESLLILESTLIISKNMGFVQQEDSFENF